MFVSAESVVMVELICELLCTDLAVNTVAIGCV